MLLGSPFALHALPISSSLTWSFIKSANYEAPCYAVFSTLLSCHPSFIQIFSLSPCSQTPVAYAPYVSQTQVLNSYRTTGKITVLSMLIFRFLDSRWEDRSFWSEWQQALQGFNLLISSSIKFWSVTLTPNIWTVTPFQTLFAIFMFWFWPSFWWWDSRIYLIFSMLILSE
jgi:hypothetical protein